MIDIHSHIVAGIDDGSKDIEMTINMLKKAEKSGTTDIVATPHFMRGRFEVEYNEVLKKVEELKEISREDIIYNPPTVKDISFTVSSIRIDCIISGLYNISRQESAKLINNEKVQINYEKITSCSKEIKSGCLISVRGKGRSQITNIGDLTKKGKIKVQGKILL